MADTPLHHERRRAIAMAALLVLQSLCGGFYAVELIIELRGMGLVLHTGMEAVVTAVLLASVVFTAIEIRRALARIRRVEAALELASGDFAELVRRHFEAWDLTPAEWEIAMLALKGFGVKEIAEYRSSAQGTVRAQLARIYAKSGHSSHVQFVCSFIDELLERSGVDTPPVRAMSDVASRS